MYCYLIIYSSKNSIDYVLASNSGESYLLSFPKVYIQNAKQNFLPFKIQDLKLNLEQDLILPHQQTPDRISFFSLSKTPGSKQLALNELELKPQNNKAFYSTENRVLLVEEAFSHFFLLCQNPTSKVFISFF